MSKTEEETPQEWTLEHAAAFKNIIEHIAPGVAIGVFAKAQGLSSQYVYNMVGGNISRGRYAMVMKALNGLGFRVFDEVLQLSERLGDPPPNPGERVTFTKNLAEAFKTFFSNYLWNTSIEGRERVKQRDMIKDIVARTNEPISPRNITDLQSTMGGVKRPKLRAVVSYIQSLEDGALYDKYFSEVDAELQEYMKEPEPVQPKNLAKELAAMRAEQGGHVGRTKHSPQPRDRVR